MAKELIHGRPSTYNNHKCRCDECKAAWARYMRPRVKAHRQKERERKLREKQQVSINI